MAGEADAAGRRVALGKGVWVAVGCGAAVGEGVRVAVGRGEALGVVVLLRGTSGIEVGEDLFVGVVDGTELGVPEAVAVNVAVGVVVGGSPTRLNVPEAFQAVPTKT
jgi:hypothetical protein